MKKETPNSWDRDRRDGCYWEDGREDTRRQSGGRSVWMSYGRAMERLNEQRDAASPPARVSRHNSGDWRREEKKKWWRLDARRRAGGLCEGSRRTRRRWRLRGRCPHYSPPPHPTHSTLLSRQQCAASPSLTDKPTLTGHAVNNDWDNSI